MNDIWTEERAAEFMKILGTKVDEMSEALSNEDMTKEERFKTIDDMMAYLDLMNMVDSARKRQIRRDVKKTLKEYAYAALKLIRIKKKGH